MDNNKSDYVQVFNNRGFQISVNGVVLSVQFGYGSYTENRDEAKLISSEKPPQYTLSHNCEIALFPQPSTKSEMEWLTREVWKELYGEDLGEDVVGYLPPSKLVELIAHLSQGRWKRVVIT